MTFNNMTDNENSGLVNNEESFSLLLKVADLVEDKFALYDLLADESEGGNALALDVMNEIWPPENIIEED